MEIEATYNLDYSCGGHATADVFVGDEWTQQLFPVSNYGSMTLMLHVYIKNGNVTHYYNPEMSFNTTKEDFEKAWEFLINNSVHKYAIQRNLTFHAALKPDETAKDYKWMGKPIFKDIYDKLYNMMVDEPLEFRRIEDFEAYQERTNAKINKV